MTLAGMPDVVDQAATASSTAFFSASPEAPMSTETSFLLASALCPAAGVDGEALLLKPEPPHPVRAMLSPTPTARAGARRLVIFMGLSLFLLSGAAGAARCCQSRPRRGG